MKLNADTIRKHLKELYGFKDEYNQRYKNEEKLIEYVYRLSHPSVKPYLHILRNASDNHILVLDLNYREAVETTVGMDNTNIVKNSNYNSYSIPPEYAPKKPLKGKPSPPGIGCDFYSISQLERFMDSIFGLKPIKGN